FSNHVRELWTSQSAPGWHISDLTAVTGSPIAYHTPSGYEEGGDQRVIFRSWADGSVWEMSSVPNVGWQSRDISTPAGARVGLYTPAPVGLAWNAGGDFVAYGDSNNRLHVLFNYGSGWGDAPIGIGHVASTDILWYYMDASQSARGGRLGYWYEDNDNGHVH